jgi:hypothetical protein
MFTEELSIYLRNRMRKLRITIKAGNMLENALILLICASWVMNILRYKTSIVSARG